MLIIVIQKIWPALSSLHIYEVFPYCDDIAAIIFLGPNPIIESNTMVIHS